MRQERRGWRMLRAPLLAFLPSSSPSPIPLFFSFLFFFSFWLHRFLICFFFFLSPLSPSFFPLLLLLAFFSLCLSPLSSLPLFFFGNQPLSLPSPSFSSFEINHFLFHLIFFFFLRELLVLCVLRELLVLYAFEGIACTLFMM